MVKLLKGQGCDIDTVTVSELVAKLQEFPQEMAVAYAWEGQILPVDLQRIEIEELPETLQHAVVLDAET